MVVRSRIVAISLAHIKRLTGLVKIYFEVLACSGWSHSSDLFQASFSVGHFSKNIKIVVMFVDHKRQWLNVLNWGL